MAIHFWDVDDRNGRPAIGKLTEMKHNSEFSNDGTSKSYLPSSDKGHSKRLTLEITAVQRVGLEVSISGGNTVMKNLRAMSQDNTCTGTHANSHLQRNLQKLLSSIQDPFKLSASDALLSAAVICAENRCHAALNALTRLGKNQNGSTTSSSFIPSSTDVHGAVRLRKELPS